MLTRLKLLGQTPLVHQAGVYTVSNLLGRAIPFLLLPVLTRFLTPTDYGIVAMFLLSASLVEPFISLGLPAAITVKFFDPNTDIAVYLFTGLVVVASVALPVGLVIFATANQLSFFTQVPSAWLLMVVPLALTRAFGVTFLTLLRVREKALLYAVLQNSQSVGLILLTIGLVVGLGLDWRGRVVSEISVWVSFAVVGLFLAWRSGWMRAVFRSTYARHLAVFGLPLIPHTLGAVLIAQTDRLLLTNLVGVEETGLYAVGYQLALVVELVAVSFNYAYAPWLFRILAGADHHDRRRLVRYTYLQFGAMGVLALIVSTVMPWLAGLLLDPRYAASGQYVGWLSLGFLFSAMYYMVTNYIFYAQRTGFLAVITISTAIVNIPLTYVLIQANGGVGAAQATAVSLALSFVGTWLVSQRVYPMPWFRLGRRD